MNQILRNLWLAAAMLLLSMTSAIAQREVDNGPWRILEARYGTAARNADVTSRLRELASLDREFRIDNQIFGVDPDPGRVKTLRIYARAPNGTTRTFEYREGDGIDGNRFSGWRGGDWGHGARDKDQFDRGGWQPNDRGYRESGRDRPGRRMDRSEVTIQRAAYGSGRRTRDVTDRVRSMARDGSVDVEVNNDSMGGDPAPGAEKSLSVTYSIGGRGEQRVRIRENDRLRIP